jgi:ABC-2 type transport system permease protein
MSAGEVSGRQVVRLVVRREIRMRVRSKAMVVSTIVFLVAILALAILPGVLGGDDVHRVGMVGPGSEAIVEQLTAAASDDFGRIEPIVAADRAQGEQRVRDGDLEVLIIDGRVLVVDEELDGRFEALLQSAHRQASVTAALAGAGLAPERIRDALDPAPMELRTLQPKDEGAEQRRFLAFAGTVLLYIELIFAGSMIASGVVEEKTSRVVELLLAKASSTQLLTGKVLGMGLLALAELTLYVTVGLTAATLAGTIDLPPATVQAGVLVVFWFILGFALYSSLFVVAGALAGRPEDLQNTSQVVSLVVMIGYLAGIVTFIDPNGTIARLGALFPLTAPLVQPVRAAAGATVWWEPIVGVIVVSASIVVAMRIAARVYAGGALHFQGPLKLREALRRGARATGSDGDRSVSASGEEREVERV